MLHYCVFRVDVDHHGWHQAGDPSIKMVRFSLEKQGSVAKYSKKHKLKVKIWQSLMK